MHKIVKIGAKTPSFISEIEPNWPIDKTCMSVKLIINIERNNWKTNLIDQCLGLISSKTVIKNRGVDKYIIKEIFLGKISNKRSVVINVRKIIGPPIKGIFPECFFLLSGESIKPKWGASLIKRSKKQNANSKTIKKIIFVFLLIQYS